MGEDEKNVLKTYGFDLNSVILDARDNGNPEFADLIEKCIANLQACYDAIAQKWTSTGENAWKVDAEYVKAKMK